eukprot:gene34967-45251_t
MATSSCAKQNNRPNYARIGDHMKCLGPTMLQNSQGGLGIPVLCNIHSNDYRDKDCYFDSVRSLFGTYIDDVNDDFIDPRGKKLSPAHLYVRDVMADRGSLAVHLQLHLRRFFRRPQLLLHVPALSSGRERLASPKDLKVYNVFCSANLLPELFEQCMDELICPLSSPGQEGAGRTASRILSFYVHIIVYFALLSLVMNLSLEDCSVCQRQWLQQGLHFGFPVSQPPDLTRSTYRDAEVSYTVFFYLDSWDSFRD